MLSDHVISIAGHSITITSHDLFLTGISILTGLFFWTILYFSRKRVVVLKRSASTDQIVFELSRIGNALDRIANQPAERAIAAAVRRQEQKQVQASQATPPGQSEPKRVSYSMFGR